MSQLLEGVVIVKGPKLGGVKYEEFSDAELGTQSQTEPRGAPLVLSNGGTHQER